MFIYISSLFKKESILCLIFYGETTKELHSNLLRSFLRRLTVNTTNRRIMFY